MKINLSFVNKICGIKIFKFLSHLERGTPFQIKYRLGKKKKGCLKRPKFNIWAYIFINKQ